jgi:HK97 family phage major capsid protein
MREAVAISEQAEREGRQMTADEYARGRDLHQQALAAGGVADEAVVKALYAPGSGGASTGVSAGGGFSNATGLGDQFISSKGYQAVRDASSRAQQWSSGLVELHAKTTLTSTPGTALTPAGYRPGIVETLSQTNYVADLMPNEPAPGNPVRFVQETTATNAAAAVAEAGLKPESTFVFTEVSEPVRKLATFLPVSDELFEDAPQIGAYLNQRLALFVRNAEEAQLLLGSGVAPNLQGFVASGRAIGTYVRSAGTTNERAILNAATGCRGSSFLEPDTCIIHPTNYLAIRAGTDTTGNYLGGRPAARLLRWPAGPRGRVRRRAVVGDARRRQLEHHRRHRPGGRVPRGRGRVQEGRAAGRGFE